MGFINLLLLLLNAMSATALCHCTLHFWAPFWHHINTLLCDCSALPFGYYLVWMRAIAQYILVAIPIPSLLWDWSALLFSSAFINAEVLSFSSHWSYAHCISLNPILISRPKLACRSIGLVTFAITAIAAKFSFDSLQSTSFAIVLLLQLCSHSDYFAHFHSLSFYYWQLRQYNFFFMLRSGDFRLSRPFIVGFQFCCCHCSRLH